MADAAADLAWYRVSGKTFQNVKLAIDADGIVCQTVPPLTTLEGVFELDFYNTAAKRQWHVTPDGRT